jgi:DNA sulfur modification protein DndD
VILTDIRLHNFGIYRGQHHVLLTPPSRKKPVILFGGMNGGGKTTLLDALQLSLYGKRARCSTRGDLPYPDYLRNATHRKVDPADGAAVSLGFRHTAEGQAHDYQVRRSWTTTASGTRERVEVTKDGEPDSVLTETWDDQVDAFLPQELSHLFFFDGEKIKALAERGRSSEILRAAIYSLLGIDLVDRLSADLVTAERRARNELADEAQRVALEGIQCELDQLALKRMDLVQRRGAAQNDVDRRSLHLSKVDEKLRGEGGDAFESRATLEAQRDSLQGELQTLEAEIRDAAASELPLSMLRDQLASTLDQAQGEHNVGQAEALRSLLAERDAEVLARVESLVGRGASLDSLREWLLADRQSRTQVEKQRRVLGLPDESLASLRHLVVGGMEEAVGHLRRRISRAETIQARLVLIERRLAMAPDKEAIAHLLEARATARAGLETAQGTLTQVDEELAQLARQEADTKARHSKLAETQVAFDFKREDAHRIVRATGRVRTSLMSFKLAVIQRHARRIEELILESFKHLMRKSTMVASIRIDPASFDMDLRDDDGTSLPADRLSAGERQLLAVAILWGLAKASGRNLPAVIDTPLGRLDSVHRRHMVERYFPHASHQVLLLSTDEEINEAQLDRLRPFIGRSYRLDYDEKQDAATVQAGYFW